MTSEARHAIHALLDAPESDWLDAARSAVVKADTAAACAILAAARARFGTSEELCLTLAGALWQACDLPGAEAVLRELLTNAPGHPAATLTLARLLREQARMCAAEDAITTSFAASSPSIGTRIQGIELLDDCGRKQAAADLAEQAIAAGSTDPRMHAYAGMLDMQIGAFERARRRCLYALQHDPRALDWQSASGYVASKRYESLQDADFAMLQGWLARDGLSDRARASLLFALGKMHDDVGDVEAAAHYLRDGNALVGRMTPWSRKDWRRLVAARLDARPIPHEAAVVESFVPIFVLGMPRSGTTLVADRLARFANVRNRGELTSLGHLAGALSRQPANGAALGSLADRYRRQVIQDDAPARFFIDKQPLNFLHAEVIVAAFPNARVICCERSPQDTALSVWSQYFAGSEYAFAYDFADIAAVALGCGRLLARARQRHPEMFRVVRYEKLVSDIDGTVGELANWIGLDSAGEPIDAHRVISTSSAWQARQPVYTRSVGRWRAYAPHVPELLRIAEE